MMSLPGFYCAIHASYCISLAMLQECEHEVGKAPELLIRLESIATFTIGTFNKVISLEALQCCHTCLFCSFRHVLTSLYVLCRSFGTSFSLFCCLLFRPSVSGTAYRISLLTNTILRVKVSVTWIYEGVFLRF